MAGYSAFNCKATLCLPCASQVLFTMTFQNNAINWQQQTQLSTKFMNPEPPPKNRIVYIFSSTPEFVLLRQTQLTSILSIR